MIVNDRKRYTLSLGLANLYGAQSRQIDLVMAGAVLAAVPSLIVFFLLRKQLLEVLPPGPSRVDLGLVARRRQSLTLPDGLGSLTSVGRARIETWR
jgi:hypothetical protein